LVVLEGLDHEQREIHTAGEVALEDGIAHVAAPHGQALALALLEPAATRHSPPRVAGEYPPARFHLVVELSHAGQPSDRVESFHREFERPRVGVPAISGDVPSAREQQACPGTGAVQHCLRRPRRVMLKSPGNQHGEHAVATRYRPLDDLAVVRRSREDRNAVLELGQLSYAGIAADRVYLVASV